LAAADEARRPPGGQRRSVIREAAADFQVGDVLAAGPRGVGRAGGVARARRVAVDGLVLRGVVVLHVVDVAARVLQRGEDPHEVDDALADVGDSALFAAIVSRLLNVGAETA
jgi:hypothetical protein